MAEYEKKVRKVLQENDCTFIRRGKGDHDIWYSPITKRHVTVDTKIKSRHTATVGCCQSSFSSLALLGNPCMGIVSKIVDFDNAPNAILKQSGIDFKF